jgi:hypothetical protein
MSGRRLRAAALALTGACVGLLTWGARAADPPPAEGDPSAWVDEQVAKRQPSAEDRRLDEVGWAKDIRTAEKLAKDTNRLVFLFTHDGHMGVGRC